MKKFAITAAALLGLTFCGIPTAQAGGIQFSIGQFGRGFGYGNSRYGFSNGRHRSGFVNPGRYYGRPGRIHHPRHGHYDYHDTSHYDYVPGHVVPHGNHLHYVPGQVYFHQQGHFDYHRGRHHHGH